MQERVIWEMRMGQLAPMSTPLLQQTEADRQTVSQRFPVIMARTWAKRNGLTRQTPFLPRTA